MVVDWTLTCVLQSHSGRAQCVLADRRGKLHVVQGLHALTAHGDVPFNTADTCRGWWARRSWIRGSEHLGSGVSLPLLAR